MPLTYWTERLVVPASVAPLWAYRASAYRSETTVRPSWRAGRTTRERWSAWSAMATERFASGSASAPGWRSTASPYHDAVGSRVNTVSGDRESCSASATRVFPLPWMPSRVMSMSGLEVPAHISGRVRRDRASLRCHPVTDVALAI
jgi:hypothetical protein